MNAKTREKLPTLIGAGIAFVTFAIYAAVPSILYGGYVGLILNRALFDATADPTTLGKVITAGGMVLGLVATLFLFLVAGAFLGQLVWFVAKPVVRALMGTEAEPATEQK